MPPKKSDEPTEEEVAAAAAAEALRLAQEEEEKNPFSQYDAIWQLDTLDAQRKLVSERFNLEDGPSHSRQAIALDNCFHHLVFCKSVNMCREQAEEFYNIYTKLEEASIRGQTPEGRPLDADACLRVFRGDVLENSTLNPPPVVVVEEVVETSQEEEKSTKNKNTTKSKKAKSFKDIPAEPVSPEPVLPLKDPLLKLFTPEQIKAIITYSTEGLLGHFTLYRSMFNREVFEQKTNEDVLNMRVNTLIVDGLALVDAVDQTTIQERRDAEAEKLRLAEIAEEERLAELRKPEIAKLVEKHLALARHEMMKKLDEQNAALETELEEVIAQMQG